MFGTERFLAWGLGFRLYFLVPVVARPAQYLKVRVGVKAEKKKSAIATYTRKEIAPLLSVWWTTNSGAWWVSFFPASCAFWILFRVESAVNSLLFWRVIRYPWSNDSMGRQWIGMTSKFFRAFRCNRSFFWAFRCDRSFELSTAMDRFQYWEQ